MILLTLRDLELGMLNRARQTTLNNLVTWEVTQVTILTNLVQHSHLPILTVMWEGRCMYVHWSNSPRLVQKCLTEFLQQPLASMGLKLA